eukprot:5765391-Prymnesium_polylepis.1
MTKLNGNRLTGSIPDSLGGCAALYELRVQNNQLTGNLPAALGNCTKLRVLAVDEPLLQQIPEALLRLRESGKLRLGTNLSR